MPIASAPIIPATPWTELTSNASSIFRRSLKKITPKYDAIPTANPIANACSTLTYPEAGVIPASPAIAPFIAAITLGLWVRIQERATQTNAETDEAICVTIIVLPATPPEAKALPALNPNQPNHKSEDPRTASGILCGTIIAGP